MIVLTTNELESTSLEECLKRFYYDAVYGMTERMNQKEKNQLRQDLALNYSYLKSRLKKIDMDIEFEKHIL